MFFFADAVFGVVESPVLPVFGVVAFGVTVLGVAALGVATLGVATFGVDDLGVAALALKGSGVATFGVNALRGLCDLRCGLADTRGFSTFGAFLTGVLRSCFSTLGEGWGSCRTAKSCALDSLSTCSVSCVGGDCCGVLSVCKFGTSREGSSG